jgi:TolA-binding protein
MGMPGSENRPFQAAMTSTITNNRSMADSFDPYQTWLGIPPEEQPPDHYRLLGIARFERDRVLIEAAALQRIANLEAVRTGEHVGARLKLILEIRAARSCLLNENRRRVYDQSLERAAEKTAVTQPQAEELELAPLDDEPAYKPRPAQQPATVSQPAPVKPPPPPPKGPPPAGSPAQAATPPGTAAAGGAGSLLDEELAEHFAKLAEQELLRSLSQRKGWRRFFGRSGQKKTPLARLPLVLAAGGLLLSLLLLGVLLVRVMMRPTGDDLLRQASNEYRAGAYARATAKFDDYLQRFPQHEGVALARVRRGLAQLRAAARTAHWPRALQTAKDVLPQIAPLAEFPAEAPPVLAPLLCDIAEGLAVQARGQADPALLQQAQESLALLDRYVPKSQQSAMRLGRIEAALSLARQEITQPTDLP